MLLAPVDGAVGIIVHGQHITLGIAHIISGTAGIGFAYPLVGGIVSIGNAGVYSGESS